ncbi:MAG TPA: hypothetical protein VFA45_20255 [Actinomycetes bacterium]|nr:hypothetical protein [Actinomycetes bacterium]
MADSEKPAPVLLSRRRVLRVALMYVDEHGLEALRAQWSWVPQEG